MSDTSGASEASATECCAPCAQPKIPLRREPPPRPACATRGVKLGPRAAPAKRGARPIKKVESESARAIRLRAAAPVKLAAPDRADYGAHFDAAGAAPGHAEYVAAMEDWLNQGQYRGDPPPRRAELHLAALARRAEAVGPPPSPTVSRLLPIPLSEYAAYYSRQGAAPGYGAYVAAMETWLNDGQRAGAAPPRLSQFHFEALDAPRATSIPAGRELGAARTLGLGDPTKEALRWKNALWSRIQLGAGKAVDVASSGGRTWAVASLTTPVSPIGGLKYVFALKPGAVELTATATPAQRIAARRNGAPIIIALDGRVLLGNDAVSHWTDTSFPGRAIDIAAGVSDVYAVRDDGTLWRLDLGNSLTPGSSLLPRSPIQPVPKPPEPRPVVASARIFTGGTVTTTPTPLATPSVSTLSGGSSWKLVPSPGLGLGKLKRVSVSDAMDDVTYWAVHERGFLVTNRKPSFSTPPFKGALDVAVSPKTGKDGRAIVWALDGTGALWRHEDNAWWPTNGTGVSVDVDADGHPWVAKGDGTLWVLGARSFAFWGGPRFRSNPRKGVPGRPDQTWCELLNQPLDARLGEIAQESIDILGQAPCGTAWIACDLSIGEFEAFVATANSIIAANELGQDVFLIWPVPRTGYRAIPNEMWLDGQWQSMVGREFDDDVLIRAHEWFFDELVKTVGKERFARVVKHLVIGGEVNIWMARNPGSPAAAWLDVFLPRLSDAARRSAPGLRAGTSMYMNTSHVVQTTTWDRLMRSSDFMSFTYYQHPNDSPFPDPIDVDDLLDKTLLRITSSYPNKGVLLHEVGCGTDPLFFPGQPPKLQGHPPRDVPPGESAQADFLGRVTRRWNEAATLIPLLAWFVPFDWPISNRDGSGCNTSTVDPITGTPLPYPIDSTSTTDPSRTFPACNPCIDAACRPCRWGDVLSVVSTPDETASLTRAWNVYFASCGLVDAAGRPKYAWEVLSDLVERARHQAP